MKIAIGADHGGYSLKRKIVKLIKELGHEARDIGTFSEDSVDYPEQAYNVASLITSGECDCGVLICGTGIGMSMAANRVPGIRAALCHEIFTAKMSRAHNDANILCLGGRVIGPALAYEMVKVWLTTPFEGGRHLRRISMFEPSDR